MTILKQIFGGTDVPEIVLNSRSNLKAIWERTFTNGATMEFKSKTNRKQSGRNLSIDFGCDLEAIVAILKKTCDFDYAGAVFLQCDCDSAGGRSFARYELESHPPGEIGVKCGRRSHQNLK